MKQYLILAVALGLIAGDARAQIKPIKPIAPIGAPATPHVDTFNPYAPPKSQSVYADGPFSPTGEAKRQRRENAAPAAGPFSPEAEAKRRKEQEKGYHPF